MLLKVTQNNKKMIANSMYISFEFSPEILTLLDDLIYNV